jgi:hypothetical protein
LPHGQTIQNPYPEFLKISGEEFLDVFSSFQTEKVKKKENFLAKGKLCKHQYFVPNGCIRKFFVNKKGMEQTTEFAIKNWWITDNTAYERHRQQNSTFRQSKIQKCYESTMRRKKNYWLLFQSWNVISGLSAGGLLPLRR